MDGLRALSITLVIVAHLGWYPEGPLRPAFDLGELGVRVFFVISGFLITRLLLQERQRTGTIALGDFYLRRAFRIFPAYYLFLFVVVGLNLAGVVALSAGDLRAGFTYTMNYHPERAWYLGHVWSLSVEEQFYLLWPALLLLAGTRRGLLCAAAALLLAPVLRVVTWRWLPGQSAAIGESFHTVFDTLATGCLLAGITPWLERRPRALGRYLAFLRSPWFFLVPLLAYLCHAGRAYVSFDYPFGQTLRNVAIALCVDRWVRTPGDAVGRVLNHPGVAAVGRMSYSLYLWQQLFLAPKPLWPGLRFPLNLLAAVAVAFLSYRLVEQPCQRFYRQRRAVALGRPPSLRPAKA